MITKTKEDIANCVCWQTTFPENTILTIMGSIFDNIIAEMENGNRVQFTGFGTFEPKERAKRVGRNLHTNEIVVIPACVSPTFRAGNKMTQRVKKEIIQ